MMTTNFETKCISVPSDLKTIRKETIMEVTYEDAVSLENGAIGKW
jgi:hypothetical protein